MNDQRFEEVRNFIVQNLDEHPADIARLVADRFNVSRQSAINYLNKLMAQGTVTATGNTKARKYSLRPVITEFTIDVTADLEEDVIWRQRVLPALHGLKDNVLGICTYGFTEMLNNVVAHSESPIALVSVEYDAAKTQITITDAGVGIFNKIQREFGLDDPRQALLELSKGKLTTDPEHHSGEGIFFTSRIFDDFIILSGRVFFHRINTQDDQWLLDVKDQAEITGTSVFLTIRNDSATTTKDTMDRFASEEDNFRFSRTHIPIQLAIYEGEQLISRSQAKRILARADRFSEVMLDYHGVTEIGQAFADEVYRVYQRAHPDVTIVSVNTTAEIRNMMNRALANSGEQDASNQKPSQGVLI